MERPALESNTISQDQSCQSFKQEPHYRSKEASSPASSACIKSGPTGYFINPLDFPAQISGVNSRERKFHMSRLNHLGLTACATSTFPHGFMPPVCPGTTLTRTHAMHSLFETYTIESVGGALDRRQYTTSVRMNHLETDRKLESTSKRGNQEEEEEEEEQQQCLSRDPSPMQSDNPCGKQHQYSDDGMGDTDEGLDIGDLANGASRASYMCRKCKAHGQAVPVKRHKRACPFLQCRCLKCRLVDQGRKVVARQIALYRDQKGHSHGDRGSRIGREAPETRQRTSVAIRSSVAMDITSSSPASSLLHLPRELHDAAPRLSLTSPTASMCNNTKGCVLTEPNVAGPHCRRCRNHHVAVTWKGHKKACPYRNCPCDPCRLINVRKDTEKTLRDMAGIEAKTSLPLAIPSGISNTSGFLPYLPINSSRAETESLSTSQLDLPQLDQQIASTQNQPCYNNTGGVDTQVQEKAQFNGLGLSGNLSPVQRRTKSLQDMNSSVVSGELLAQLSNAIDVGDTVGGRFSHRRPENIHNSGYSGSDLTSQHTVSPIDSSLQNNGSLSLAPTCPPSTSPIDGMPGFEISSSDSMAAIYNQRNYESFYYDSVAQVCPDARKHEEKPPPPRSMLPFWQSFGHFEAEKAAELRGTSSYLGGGTAAIYYGGLSHQGMLPLEGMPNGRVFHGNTGGHMYSPERVSAVAAAAAAAAAMVAMTPPMNNAPSLAYQQSCYGQHSLNRGGFYHPQFPSAAVEPPCGQTGEGNEYLSGSNGSYRDYGYATRMSFGPTHLEKEERIGQPRFPAELARNRCEPVSDYWGSAYGWGPYRYPYNMMRNLPLTTVHQCSQETDCDQTMSTEKSPSPPSEAPVIKENIIMASERNAQMILQHDDATMRAMPTDICGLRQATSTGLGTDLAARVISNTQHDGCLWRNQLHQLSISRLNSGENDIKDHQIIIGPSKPPGTMEKQKIGSMHLGITENVDRPIDVSGIQSEDEGSPINPECLPTGDHDFTASRQFFSQVYSQRPRQQPRQHAVDGTLTEQGTFHQETSAESRTPTYFQSRSHVFNAHSPMADPVKIMSESPSGNTRVQTVRLASLASNATDSQHLMNTSPVSDPPAISYIQAPRGDDTLRVGSAD